MKNLALLALIALGSTNALAAKSENIQNCVYNSTLRIEASQAKNQLTGEITDDKFAVLTCTGSVAEKLYVDLGDDDGVRKIRDNGVNYMFFGNSPSQTKCLYDRNTASYKCVLEIDIMKDVLFN